MYKTVSDFPYADGYYMIMPPGLPSNFYPEDPNRKHVTDEYVICFQKNTPEDIKKRLIRDYAEYHKKEKESGIYK